MWKIKIFLILSFVSGAAFAECKNPKVTLVGATQVEEKAACESLETIVNFFKSIGAETDPKITFVFEDEVMVTMPNGDRLRVFGSFDTKTQEIRMTHFESPMQKDREVWGQKWSNELVTSMLLHEATHLVAISYMGERFKNLPYFGHEFVAYAVQFMVMGSDLRSKILDANPEKPFTDSYDVSGMHYDFDPFGFAIRAYLSTMQWGGGPAIKKILDGEIRIIDSGFQGF